MKRKDLAAEGAAVIAPLFKEHGWEYNSKTEEYPGYAPVVPNEEQIAAMADHLIDALKEATDKPFASSGRLLVMRGDPGTDMVHLYLDLGYTYLSET